MGAVNDVSTTVHDLRIDFPFKTLLFFMKISILPALPASDYLN